MSSSFNCQIKKFELLPGDSNSVFVFDFDGVFHNNMKKGENIETKKRSPDHKFLRSFIKDINLLEPYLIKSTFLKIKTALAKGHQVYILSANTFRLRIPIQRLLKKHSIEIPLKNIIMKTSNKPDKLVKIKATEFTDDSMVNIKSVFEAYKKNKDMKYLKKLIWVWPEENKFYDIDLKVDKLSIFKKGWAKKIREGQKISGVKQIKNPEKIS